MNRKFRILTKLCAAALVLLSPVLPAHAYVVDQLIGQVKSPNSSEQSELDGMRSASGINDLTLDFKYNFQIEDIRAYPDTGSSGQWYIDISPNAPGYFALKFGIGGTNATADTFFFKNVGELTKFVWTNEQVQFLTGGDCSSNKQDNNCNIGRLSHYAAFSGDSTDVPEPATITIIGIGLLGVALSRRKIVKNYSA